MPQVEAHEEIKAEPKVEVKDVPAPVPEVKQTAIEPVAEPEPTPPASAEEKPAQVIPCIVPGVPFDLSKRGTRVKRTAK